MTVESQENFDDNHLPTLDFKLSMVYDDKGISKHITYTYFEKEMNTRYVTMEHTAMAYQDKIQSLSMEVVRRLSRMELHRSTDEKIQVLNDLSEKL